jgi:hypothetical protein
MGHPHLWGPRTLWCPRRLGGGAAAHCPCRSLRWELGVAARRIHCLLGALRDGLVSRRAPCRGEWGKGGHGLVPNCSGVCALSWKVLLDLICLCGCFLFANSPPPPPHAIHLGHPPTTLTCMCPGRSRDLNLGPYAPSLRQSCPRWLGGRRSLLEVQRPRLRVSWLGDSPGPGLTASLPATPHPVL